MPLVENHPKIFHQFQTYQNLQTHLNQLSEKITNYQKYWTFLHPDISYKINYYKQLEEEQQAEIEQPPKPPLWKN